MDVDAAIDRARRLVADCAADHSPVDAIGAWVCCPVGGCTCGSDGISHMSGCGYEPIMKLDSFEGARAVANAVNLTVRLLQHVARARHDVLGC